MHYILPVGIFGEPGWVDKPPKGVLQTESGWAIEAGDWRVSATFTAQDRGDDESRDALLTLLSNMNSVLRSGQPFDIGLDYQPYMPLSTFPALDERCVRISFDKRGNISVSSLDPVSDVHLNGDTRKLKGAVSLGKGFSTIDIKVGHSDNDYLRLQINPLKGE